MSDARAVHAEVTLDGSRVVFNYRSEGKPNVSALRRELADRLSPKVELRSVGPREAARQCGGYGLCGTQMCCTRFPLLRAADRSAHGEGPGPPDDLGPYHRPVRPSALLSRLRASAVQELSRTAHRALEPWSSRPTASARSRPTPCPRTRASSSSRARRLGARPRKVGDLDRRLARGVRGGHRAGTPCGHAGSTALGARRPPLRAGRSPPRPRRQANEEGGHRER